MKKILIFLAFIQCNSNADYLITKNQIGPYILGSKVEKEYNHKIFDFKFDDSKNLSSIVVSSKLYKTAEGLGVGSKVSEVLRTYEGSVVSKSNNKNTMLKVGQINTIATLDGILFVDIDENDIVDFVSIQKLK